jgi:hypothetical protein
MQTRQQKLNFNGNGRSQKRYGSAAVTFTKVVFQGIGLQF